MAGVPGISEGSDVLYVGAVEVDYLFFGHYVFILCSVLKSAPSAQGVRKAFFHPFLRSARRDLNTFRNPPVAWRAREVKDLSALALSISHSSCEPREFRYVNIQLPR
jgi:hypothetical protein